MDLHAVDWANVTVPGAVCGLPGSIPLRNKAAVVSTNHWPPYSQVHVGEYGDPAYGDLEKTGQDDAGIDIVCDNGGGTADSQLAEGWAIFSGRGGTLHPLGAVTPQQPATPGLHVPLVGPITIVVGSITAYENWYGPDDPTCCPTGKTTTQWTDMGNGLVATSHTVVASPSP